jgi:predicted DNA-binding protein with PD1-like motif
LFKKIHVFRVKPGRELLAEIIRYCAENNVTSGIVLGIIGSATKATLTFLHSLPGNYVPEDFTGPLEIVAAQGSVAVMDANTIAHIHIQLAVKDACRGGHLVSAEVFSTAEVTIGELDYPLRRRYDGYTGLNELEENG